MEPPQQADTPPEVLLRPNGALPTDSFANLAGRCTLNKLERKHDRLTPGYVEQVS